MFLMFHTTKQNTVQNKTAGYIYRVYLDPLLWREKIWTESEIDWSIILQYYAANATF